MFQLFCCLCQDALYKEHSGKELKARINATLDIMERSHPALKEFKSSATINIGYLEGMAGIRFAIMEIAKFLPSLFRETVSQELQQLGFPLMQAAEEVCKDPAINSPVSGDVVGPALYLLKLVVRLHSIPFLKRVSGEYHWIIPEALRTTNQVQHCKVCVSIAYNFPLFWYLLYVCAGESHRSICDLHWQKGVCITTGNAV